MVSKDSILLFDYDNYKIERQHSRNLFVDNSGYTMITMNETGKNILKLLDGKNTVQDVIQTMAKIHDLPESVVDEYVYKFIDKLYSDELIHLANKPLNKKEFQSLSRVYIFLTEKDERGKIQELPLKKIQEIFQKIDTMDNKVEERKITVHLIGEPLQHSKWKKVIDYLHSISYVKIWIYNEDVSITESMISFLKGRIDTVLLKLYHYDEEKNDIMSSEGNFGKFQKNVKRCIENDILCYAKIEPVVENIGDLSEIQQYAYNMGLKGILITKLDERKLKNLGKDVNEVQEQYKSEFMKMATNNDFINSWRNNRIQPDLRAFVLISEEDLCFRGIYSLRKRKHCGVGQEEMSISASGQIYPCHRLHYIDFAYNNIEEYFKNKDELYGENIVDSKCKECNVWMLCLGGCRADNYICNQEISKPRKDCEDRKIAVKKYLFETKDVK